MKWLIGEKNLILIAMYTILKHYKEVFGVQVLSVKVPLRARSGGQVPLSCLFDLEGKSLYSLNWWKDNQQFYQFSPSSPERKTVYETPGIDVLKSESNLKSVMLENVSEQTSGEFKCEVVADFPSYERDTLAAPMRVIDVPRRPPRISVGRVYYRVGDIMEATCTSEGSDPSPTLHWLINGKRIDPGVSRPPSNPRKNTKNDDQTEFKSSGLHNYSTLPPIFKGKRKYNSTISSKPRFSLVVANLSLVMRSTYFMFGGRTSLTCVATIPQIYTSESSTHLSLPGISAVEPSQRVSSSSRTKRFSWPLQTLLTIYNMIKLTSLKRSLTTIFI